MHSAGVGVRLLEQNKLQKHDFLTSHSNSFCYSKKSLLHSLKLL